MILFIAACSSGAVRSDSCPRQSKDGSDCTLCLWPSQQPSSGRRFSLHKGEIWSMWIHIKQKAHYEWFIFSMVHPRVSYPQCLLYVKLPFMEDLRQFTFPMLENNKKFTPSGGPSDKKTHNTAASFYQMCI